MIRCLRAIVPVLFLAACGGPSSTSTSPVTPSTPAAPTPTVTAVKVSGTVAAVGGSSQFTATATLSNGTSDDITARAGWESSNPSAATVSPGGVVKSVAAGEADIAATFSGVSGAPHVRIGSAVTTRTLTGMITDESGRPLVDGAEAQVMDGDNAGKVGRVGADGVYSIADLVAGTFMLRARANGFLSRDHQVALGDADMRVDFALHAEAREIPCTYTVSPGVIWISLGGTAIDRIQVTTSRPGCTWTATTTDRIGLGIVGTCCIGHSVSGSETAAIQIVTNPVSNRECLRVDVVRVRWDGGGSDVTLKQPIVVGPEPPLCK